MKKRKIVRMQEGDDLIIYSNRGQSLLKLIPPRWMEWDKSYEPQVRASIKFHCIDIERYNIKLDKSRI